MTTHILTLSDESISITVGKTPGDGNCFFHATAGKKNKDGRYEDPKSEEKRQELHRYLNQFNSLENMPDALQNFFVENDILGAWASTQSSNIQNLDTNDHLKLYLESFLKWEKHEELGKKYLYDFDQPEIVLLASLLNEEYIIYSKFSEKALHVPPQYDLLTEEYRKRMLGVKTRKVEVFYAKAESHYEFVQNIIREKQIKCIELNLIFILKVFVELQLAYLLDKLYEMISFLRGLFVSNNQIQDEEVYSNPNFQSIEDVNEGHEAYFQSLPCIKNSGETSELSPQVLTGFFPDARTSDGKIMKASNLEHESNSQNLMDDSMKNLECLKIKA